jgi:hypothetical protein
VGPFPPSTTVTFITRVANSTTGNVLSTPIAAAIPAYAGRSSIPPRPVSAREPGVRFPRKSREVLGLHKGRFRSNACFALGAGGFSKAG